VSSNLTIQPQSVHRSYCNVFMVPACTHALGAASYRDEATTLAQIAGLGTAPWAVMPAPTCATGGGLTTC
jgi:hypothetical protein